MFVKNNEVLPRILVDVRNSFYNFYECLLCLNKYLCMIDTSEFWHIPVNMPQKGHIWAGIDLMLALGNIYQLMFVVNVRDIFMLTLVLVFLVIM